MWQVQKILVDDNGTGSAWHTIIGTVRFDTMGEAFAWMKEDEEHNKWLECEFIHAIEEVHDTI